MTQPLSPDPITQHLYAHHRQALYKIYEILPPPLDDTPDGYAERDASVVELISQYVPASSAEAELAAMVVAGTQYWQHCMRGARQNEHDKPEHDRLTAQAARAGREARGFLISLQRVQTMRVKRESSKFRCLPGRSYRK